MEQGNIRREEVKTTGTAATTLKSSGWPRLFLPDRALDLKVTALYGLGPPSRKTDRKIAAPLARKDGSHIVHRTTKESEFAESADRSMAKGREVVALSHTERPPRRP